MSLGVLLAVPYAIVAAGLLAYLVLREVDHV